MSDSSEQLSVGSEVGTPEVLQEVEVTVEGEERGGEERQTGRRKQLSGLWWPGTGHLARTSWTSERDEERCY